MAGRIGTSSITNALRAKEILEAAHIPAEIIRLRPDESPGGCAYGVEFQGSELARAAALLSRENVKFNMLQGSP